MGVSTGAGSAEGVNPTGADIQLALPARHAAMTIKGMLPTTLPKPSVETGAHLRRGQPAQMPKPSEETGAPRRFVPSAMPNPTQYRMAAKEVKNGRGEVHVRL